MPFANWLNKRAQGEAKETEAKAHLQAQGLTFVEQNFHSRYGEIDLIFSEPQSNTLIFVEVRFRRSQQYGGAAASITPSKIGKIKKTALFYISQRRIAANIRFDVIAFEGEQLNWIPNAFT